ncbi:hypothetical protein [Natrialbaceae archaeon AArc-T1-2]|uniref:hypothetical protein n=1 Tax=Natrialbaceae archaeon AArc-T1-2 TaxID=3053904 RepID=UPI00255AE7C4|nr:hypothetical protein [Natrialbaceae archaeon AArc-T1-2]WIV66848.1 hypothetical protein QQ977_14310 [Natrialbaceae archaeon AArc-T1-2]
MQIKTYLKALTEDRNETIQYILFTRGEEFAGLLEISTAFRNGTINQITDRVDDLESDKYSMWEFLDKEDILESPGVVTTTVPIKNIKIINVIEMMQDEDTDYLPVVGKHQEFHGVITHNQIVRDILLREEENING